MADYSSESSPPPPLSSLWWNTNLPPSSQTPTCPSYLLYALDDPKDRAVLSTPDSQYTRQSWEEVCKLVREGRLDGFKRAPSELRRYRKWCAELESRKEEGGILGFLRGRRLGWSFISHSSHSSTGSGRGGAGDGDEEMTGEKLKGLFNDPDSHKILLNDWPYGIDPRIVHLVTWLKFPLPSQPITASNPNGDLTPEARTQIEEFVCKTFVEPNGDGGGGGKGRGVSRDRIVWFWNWKGLKSVHSVEHFHVMLFDPDPGFVREVTGGDVAVVDRI